MDSTKANPTLKDLLDLHKREIMLTLNCHAVGTVQSFDPVKQTCRATINYKKTIMVSGPGGKKIPKTVDYPILMDCPAIVLSGGSAGMTMPISKGDTCLILFNDRDIDTWFTTGLTSREVGTPRLHSISDAVILVGIRPATNPIPGYDSSKSVWYNGETKMELGEKVAIKNNLANFGTLLGQLIDVVAALAPVTTSPGNPTTPNPAQVSQVNYIKDQLKLILDGIA